MKSILKIFVPSILLLATLGAHAMAKESFSANVDDEGNISLPNDFRVEMAHLGSWFVPEGDASGFHDGATIVKALRASHADTYTTAKNVSYASDELKQWFVMVKDSKGRFADNPLWGDGWGWALYKPDSKEGGKFQNLASNYKTDCIGCHIPAKQNDWIYTEAYPSLKTEK